MGRTIPSFRMLLDAEIARWREFKNKLLTEDRATFDELMNSSKQYASASSCALKTNVFECLCMSVLLGCQKRIENLTAEIERLHASGDDEKI